MEEFSPLLFILIIWLCIGLPLSKISQAKKKNAPQRPFPARPVPNTDNPVRQEPATVPEPLARETRLTSTISVTANDDSIYQGSMNAVTGEGYDPCHEEDLAGLNHAESSAPVRPIGDAHSLPFGWTGSDMVRGIVVSEILNRKKSIRL